jgi:hypothetical protein
MLCYPLEFWGICVAPVRIAPNRLAHAREEHDEPVLLVSFAVNSVTRRGDTRH